MTTWRSNTGDQKQAESLQEKSTQPKTMQTIDIMHETQSNYTVYFSFMNTWSTAKYTIRVALRWHFQGQIHRCESDDLYSMAWLLLYGKHYIDTSMLQQNKRRRSCISRRENTIVNTQIMCQSSMSGIFVPVYSSTSLHLQPIISSSRLNYLTCTTSPKK